MSSVFLPFSTPLKPIHKHKLTSSASRNTQRTNKDALHILDGHVVTMCALWWKSPRGGSELLPQATRPREECLSCPVSLISPT